MQLLPVDLLLQQPSALTHGRSVQPQHASQALVVREEVQEDLLNQLEQGVALRFGSLEQVVKLPQLLSVCKQPSRLTQLWAQLVASSTAGLEQRLQVREQDCVLLLVGKMSHQALQEVDCHA